MKVSDLLEMRQPHWRELEALCSVMEGHSRRRVPPRAATRFATLYRAACADLDLADSYQLPPGTIHYLHQLVGRAHNQFYRARIFRWRQWTHELLVRVPSRLFHDNALRLALLIFWGIFVLVGALSYADPQFGQRVMASK